MKMEITIDMAAKTRRRSFELTDDDYFMQVGEFADSFPSARMDRAVVTINGVDFYVQRLLGGFAVTRGALIANTRSFPAAVVECSHEWVVNHWPRRSS